MQGQSSRAEGRDGISDAASFQNKELLCCQSVVPRRFEDRVLCVTVQLTQGIKGNGLCIGICHLLLSA